MLSSYKEPGFKTPYPDGGSQPLGIPDPGYLMASYEHQAHTVHIHSRMQALMHAHKSLSF